MAELGSEPRVRPWAETGATETGRAFHRALFMDLAQDGEYEDLWLAYEKQERRAERAEYALALVVGDYLESEGKPRIGPGADETYRLALKQADEKMREAESLFAEQPERVGWQLIC